MPVKGAQKLELLGAPSPHIVSERLERFDFSPVTARLQRKGMAEAPELEREFKRFATLWAVERGTPLSPSKPVDEYWHAIVLDTKRYSAFCETVYGRFIHHIPDDPVEGEVRDNDSYRRTLAAYERNFGKPPEKFWPAASECVGDSCHAPDACHNNCW